jgi:hypothetical protein
MEHDWNSEEPIRVCGDYSKIELMVLNNNSISLLVLPLNQIQEEKEKGSFYDGPEEKSLFMETFMFRQNVHLNLLDVQELIRALQDYVRWSIKQNEIVE